MALTDHNDVVFGATGDGWTFALLNRPIAAARGILTSAGFSPREHLGRTVYLLPPGTGGTAARTGDAIAQLLPHTLDIVELAWTAHQNPPQAGPPDVSITVEGSTVNATVNGERAHAVLTQAGFTARDDGTLRLPDGLDEPEAAGRIADAEAHLLVEGLQVRVDLGIATPDDLPPAPPRVPDPDPDNPPSVPEQHRREPYLARVRDASITVADACPDNNTPSDVYEIAVFGVSVLIRRRAQWGATTDVPYVHIEDQNDGPGLLLVEVNNGGESEHPRQLPHGASS